MSVTFNVTAKPYLPADQDSSRECTKNGNSSFRSHLAEWHLGQCELHVPWCSAWYTIGNSHYAGPCPYVTDVPNPFIRPVLITSIG
jgi:hypothetical protein